MSPSDRGSDCADLNLRKSNLDWESYERSAPSDGPAAQVINANVLNSPVGNILPTSWSHLSGHTNVAEKE